MINYLLLFLVGFILSLLLTPLARRLAIRVQAMDIPDARKVHASPVPRLGGLAIVAAFHVGLLFAFGPLPEIAYYLREFATGWFTRFLPAIAVIVIVGALDDKYSLRPLIKLGAQLVAALLAVHAGCVIQMIVSPWGNPIHLGAWSIPVTVVWILALTNAFNLIDGLDGLSCGVGAISTLTLGAVALLHQDSELVLVCALLAGALAGFLRHNFHPARVFMGDSGSLFIGFTLAILSVTAAHKSTASLSVLVPFLAFGVPLMDTLLAVLRRTLRNFGVVQETGAGKLRFLRVFEADRDHIHHRLLQLGWSQRRVVLVLYGVSLLATAVTLFIVSQRNLHLGLVFVAVGIATVSAVRWLRYRELELLRRGTLLAFARSRVLGYEFFQIPIDLILLAISLYAACLIERGSALTPEIKDNIRLTLPVMVVGQLLILHWAGLYRIRWRFAGVPDLLRGVRAIFLCQLAAVAALWLLKPAAYSLVVLLLDFFFTVTLLLSPRLSLRLLTHYAQADETDKQRVLIFGISHHADLLVRQLLADGTAIPVGFIHDGAELHGKTLHGFPILGALTDLKRIVCQQRATQLIIADDALTDDQLAAIRARCHDAAIELARFRVGLETIPPQ